MDKSQSLFLAAILLGSQKPNPPKTLRTSLYPIPIKELSMGEVQALELFSSSYSTEETSSAGVQVNLSFRDARKDYFTEDNLLVTANFDLDVTVVESPPPGGPVDYETIDSIGFTSDFNLAVTVVVTPPPNPVGYSTEDDLNFSADFNLVVTVV